MCAVYGKIAESYNSMTEYRAKMWRSETGKSGASSVKLCSIPPTTEAFTENVHICHLQVAIWKAAILESPPEMDATRYGWKLDHLDVLVPRHCAFWYIVGTAGHYYSSFTATTRHLGVALQHVAARKLGARSSVYVRVRKPVKIL